MIVDSSRDSQQIIRSSVGQKIAAFSAQSSDKQNQFAQIAAIQTSDSFKRTSIKVHTISFSGNPDKNPKQVALIGAEFPPYFKVGGVATVMKDYPDMLTSDKKIVEDARVITPYYNGKIEFDKATGEPISVGILKKDGVPVITNADLTTVKVADLKPGQYHELEEVS